MSKSVALMKPGGASAYDFGSPHPLRPRTRAPRWLVCDCLT